MLHTQAVSHLEAHGTSAHSKLCLLHPGKLTESFAPLRMIEQQACFLFHAVASDSGSKGVRVFQMDQHQSKRIFAEVKVHASVDQVWRVITDYDHLADFVPNLVSSKRIPSSKPGVIHLRQLGCSQSVFWRLEAEAVLECVEVQRVMGARELRFKAIEGDFKVCTFPGQAVAKVPRWGLPSVLCALHLHSTIHSQVTE